MAMLKASPDDLVADNKGAISYHRPAGWTPGNPARGNAFSQRLSLAKQIQARAGQSPTQIADSGQIQSDAGPEQTPYGEVSAPGTTQAPQEAQPKQLPQGAAGFNQQGQPMYVDPRFLQRPPSFTQAQIGRTLLLGDRAGADRMRQANMLANQPQTIKLSDGRIIHYLPNDPTQQWQEAAPLKIDTLGDARARQYLDDERIPARTAGQL
jgi:hypothetical protein